MLSLCMIIDGVVDECNNVFTGGRRKRRSNTNTLYIPNDNDGDYDYDPPQINITNLPNFPTKSGITQFQANRDCKDAIENSSFGKVCLKMYPDMNYTTYIEECVTDIQVGIVFEISDMNFQRRGEIP